MYSARETGDSANVPQAFARDAGSQMKLQNGTWGLRPKLYANACFAGCETQSFADVTLSRFAG